MSDQQQVVTIDDRQYPVDDLPEIAKAQVVNLKAVDEEIRRIEQKLEIYRTARTAYARVLKKEIDKIDLPSH